MPYILCNSLNELQCCQVTALHTICSEAAPVTSPAGNASSKNPIVLSLVLPEPNAEDEDTFFLLFYMEEVLVSFLSVFCPDRKTAEVSGFTHPLHRKKGYFSLLLQAARTETKIRFGNVSFLYQCLSCDPDTTSFCMRRNLKLSHSECMMAAEIPAAGAAAAPSVQLSLSGRDNREQLISLHMQAFDADRFFTESYIDTILEDPDTTSYILLPAPSFQKSQEEPLGLLHLTLDKNGRAAYLMGFGILPCFRRKGYGTKTLSALFQILPPGCLLLLQVSTSNLPAFYLYKSCGFLIQSRLDYYRESGTFISPGKKEPS
ncbi:GNAT family N-acetyltransferase [Qiania dongpingensis]|uniref:GNAT family N-acetyltransferase n=1 Tax=Qiania dongpingensis TaxID=2763669 RepID=A0A7G9G3R9_9FIRM|nr:N-acetyltransferase [Qiania dongpingensis]QNM05451.1 GNAT family N-acetyltransferase [Qiania dongpingensis]